MLKVGIYPPSYFVVKQIIRDLKVTQRNTTNKYERSLQRGKTEKAAKEYEELKAINDELQQKELEI